MSENSCHATPPPAASAAPDPFGRVVDYLRISITDRCNERCLYCMPEGYHGWAQRPDHLTAEEILRLVRVAAGLGFRKFRLTDGEPLVRADVPEIVRGMAAIPGVEAIGLSTNGTRLAALAQPLREAGVRSVNLSLDALDPALYRCITGGDVATVLAGIRAAVAAGFERVKLNAVLLRGLNEGELWPLILFAAEHGLPLRFIELMPVSRADALTDANFLPVTEVMKMLRAREHLIPQPDHHPGHGPAKYYRLAHTGRWWVSLVRSRTSTSAKPATASASPPTVKSARASSTMAKWTCAPRCATTPAKPTWPRCAPSRRCAETTGTRLPRQLHALPLDGDRGRVTKMIRR